MAISTLARMPRRRAFFGWRVVAAAFLTAFFGWGVGFYGPPIFLHVLHQERGWTIGLISVAVSCHFLTGAAVVTNLAELHRRCGLAAVTIGGALLAAFGALGWGLAQAPWQLFIAALVSGAGWAATGGAAINAIVAPWFIRQRPTALSLAFNGASVGGAVLSPLWVWLIESFGFVPAAALVGTAMVAVVAVVALRYFARGPSEMGLEPDGAPRGAAAPTGTARSRKAILGDERFATLAAAASLALFVQVGLVAHLFSVLAGALKPTAAGLAVGLTVACAIAGRIGAGAALQPGVDRRRAYAATLGLQAGGSVALLVSGGVSAPLLLAGCVLFGLGLGNITSLPPLIAQSDFPAPDVPRVVSLVVACNQATFAFAPAIFGILRGHGGRLPFAVAAVIQIVGALIVLRRRRPRA